MKAKHLLLGAAISGLTAGSMANASTFTEALTGGKASGDIRIRYESVTQDNAVDDATALTARTRIGYTTGSFEGFSATMEFEDVTVLFGRDDYTVGPTGFNPGEYSVIADPEVTEVDQAFIKYANDVVTVKAGKQVLTFDNHRFVGHVGWRQDRQTFDAITVNVKPIADLSLSYAYLEERNRIFAEAADIASEDHLFNASYKTPVGTVTGYGYFLEVDNDTDNGLDTIGVRFAGKKNKFIYSGEYASQSSESGNDDFDATYLMAEFGYNFGPVTLKGGYEDLGSDSGDYGFSTPLATLHKFNGWADQFLGTPGAGLVDLSLAVSGKAGPGKFAVIYHDYETSESTDFSDLGSEIDVVYSLKFAKQYNAGIKFASYAAGDEENGKVDADKLWIWVGAKF
ncbi:MAG: alginate export family protein [Agarilytica sp.]